MRKTLLLFGLIMLTAIVSAEVGIDYNSEGNYYDIYNEFHHYYVDAETGIDLTNDNYDFWSKKELCLEVKSGGMHKKKCLSEIPLTWSVEENEFYVKLIGELDFYQSVGDFNLVYYLGLTDSKITITPQARSKRNLDYLKFSVKDYNIRIDRDYENDFFRVDYPYYDEFAVSDGDYIEYYNVADRYYNLFDNDENRNDVDFWWDDSYYLGGEYLSWVDENLTVAFNLSRENDFVNIELTTGEIPKNTDFETNFYWVDDKGSCSVVWLSMAVIPSMYESDQEHVACSWQFSGSNCPDSVRWQTNEGIDGRWITLPKGVDKNEFGLNCGATGGATKGMSSLYDNVIYFVDGTCDQSFFGSGSLSDYVWCGSDANISNHLARCALYKDGDFKASSSNRTAICMEKILLDHDWILPETDNTETGTDFNFTIEARTECTDGYCGDANSFLQWCENEDCVDWVDVNSSSGKIILIEGSNPIQGYDLNVTDNFDLNWVIQVKETGTFELRLRSVGEFAPEETTAGIDRTITSGEPPITTSDINSDWQDFDANIHLTCEDVNNGSGCNKTYYRIDLNGLKDTNYSDWAEYDSNVLITQDGNIGIQYYSTDLVGNTEETKEEFILIDKTAHTLLTENYLPNPSNAVKNLRQLTTGTMVLSFCYYTGSNSGDAYYTASADGLYWITSVKINSNGYCSGYYSENGTEPFRTGEGGISLTTTPTKIHFLYTEWNGTKAWTRILDSNQSFNEETLINGNAGNSPNRDTLNATTDSNNSIHYTITQKAQ